MISSETQGRLCVQWDQENLRQATNVVRLERKAQLCKRFPGLFSGKHWQVLKCNTWMPLYIAQAILPRAKLTKSGYSTDLEICNVIWQSRTGPLGFTFYNNHQDMEVVSSQFSCDASSSSALKTITRTNFSHASQYLLEVAENTQLSSAATPCSAWFSTRVGFHVGELDWREVMKPHGYYLRLHFDDLTPPTLKKPEPSQGHTHAYDRLQSLTVIASK